LIPPGVDEKRLQRAGAHSHGPGLRRHLPGEAGQLLRRPRLQRSHRFRPVSHLNQRRTAKLPALPTVPNRRLMPFHFTRRTVTAATLSDFFVNRVKKSSDDLSFSDEHFFVNKNRKKQLFCTFLSHPIDVILVTPSVYFCLFLIMLNAKCKYNKRYHSRTTSIFATSL